ncbi:peamaclein-like [Vicia villosa]|uniref:peamaclein-like n=1 Tax=Vicia villosa TaxID=3911 RepID=UPI00273AB08C|nr:peamaclein-like [Vicia villosa]
MAKLAYAFLLMVVTAFVIQDVHAGGEGSLHPNECAGACNVRCSATSNKERCLEYCSATSNKERCLEYCNICCAKCLCVPSGTFGHKEECPCYNNLKNDKGGPKCP